MFAVSARKLTAVQCPAGTLPSSWSELPFTTLDLSYNTLNGTLPDVWGTSGTWAGLLNLRLQNNQLTGLCIFPLADSSCIFFLHELAKSGSQ